MKIPWPGFIKFKFDIDRMLHGDQPFAGPITLDQRRIYIVPNRQGIIFIMLMFIMFVGSVNYANSLGFMLTFLVASIMTVSIIHTYRNMLALSFSVAPISPVFCRQTVTYPVKINNPKSWARYSIKLRLQKDASVACNIDPASSQSMSISHHTDKRGKHLLSKFTVYTEYPFGIIYAWSYIKLTNSYLVYPSIEGTRPLPPELSSHTEQSGRHQEEEGDFSGLREYQTGESLRHIHWKLVAQDRGIFTKRFSQPICTELSFDWRQMPQLDVEAKLSQLCRWVIDAHAQGLHYSLWLPNTKIPMGNDGKHKDRCLEALALFPGGHQAETA